MRDKDFQMEFDAWFTSTISARDIPNIQSSNFVGHILSAFPFPFLKRPNTQEQRPPENMEPGSSASLTDSPQRSNSLLEASSLNEVSFRSTALIESENYIEKSEKSLGCVSDKVQHFKPLPGQASEPKHCSLFEALEALDLSEPIRMPNDVNFRFNTSCLSLLLSDGGETNAWYKGCCLHEMLKLSNAATPLLHTAGLDKPGQLTYGDVMKFVSSEGMGDLRRLGIKHSDQIVMYMPPPGPAGAIVLLTVCIQAIAMPLDPDATYDDILMVIKQSNPSIALGFRGYTPESFVNAVNDAGVILMWQQILEEGDKPGLYQPESVSNNYSTIDKHILRNDLSSVVLLLRTSGSTALPKLVPVTNGALTANAVALAKSLRLTDKDIALNAMPLFHIAGISASLLATISAGGSLMCLSRFEVSSFMDTVFGHQGQVMPTWFTAVPTMHLSLMLYGRQMYPQGLPKHKLRFVRTGAAPLSEADAVLLSGFWEADVVSTYSMTEQMPISSTMSQRKPGSVGEPLLVSLAVIDDSSLRPVPWGHQGEICISGYSVMEHYWKGTGDDKPFFYIGDRRFFRTGDLGFLDTDKFLYITGRSKDLIKVGGEQISPAEVESAVRKHPHVDVAVPSRTWGEEVGIALVLSALKVRPSRRIFGIGSSEPDISDIKKWSTDKLGSKKAPRYWKVVNSDDQLPKTASGKYIRNGLAEKLGVTGALFDASTAPPKGSARVSHGLSGLRYLLAVGVMFNHIGAVWQGEDERNPMTFGASFFPGRASTFYFPATVFFVLGGYSLSSALASRPIRQIRSFYSARFKALLPLYWFALLLSLVNLLVICRPSTFSSNFSWQPNMATRLLDDGSFAQCQSGPVEMPYGAWLTLTLLVFIFGLQSWFFAFILVGWILYYSWFFSVYFFILLIFPWMHNALVRSRGNLSSLLIWFVVYTVGVLISAWALSAYYLFDSWEQTYDTELAKSLRYNIQNVYALSTVIFPPYWIPVVGSGAVAYFWYDYARPNQSHYRYVYAVVCDLISVFFLLFQLFMYIDINWPYPVELVGKMWEVVAEEPHTWDSALDRYVWSVLIDRLKTPLIAIWLALLSMPGRSLTARVLEWRPLSQVLGPTSYGCFLFHQMICQWYWWATRAGSVKPTEISLAGMYAMYPETFEYSAPPTAFNYTSPKKDYTWWNFPKYYYWFSPLPLPVAWWEFAYIVMLTTLFAMFCNAYVNPPLTNLYSWICNKFSSSGASRKSTGDLHMTGLDIVGHSIQELTGEDLYDETLDLQQIGLGSVGLPIFVNALNAKDERLGLKVRDIAALPSIRELVELIEKVIETADTATGVVDATQM